MLVFTGIFFSRDVVLGKYLIFTIRRKKMKSLITVILLLIVVRGISQNDTIRNFKKDSLLESTYYGQRCPPNTPPLNGQYKLYNMHRQVTKDGIFKDNRFLDGKSYKYDGEGKLVRVEIYKDGVYMGDEN
jgi:hypothetical protein